ncbi:hypothetical protein L210DRAFT_3395087 [Boletus edulis BED1]|uniref:HNH nuclease domain-containing protein n=1 Tax=Boletus edulis BED1 TaxID=1328754 RepID=A0AAD4BYP5_BOLED|nr:hypothetical protein L210DRAFT_3395087 [Boletus edulis BED1]
MRESGSGEWIRALEIPLEDIERLSFRPLKWLRFVAFAALGAKGDLFDTSGPDRNIVNYKTVSFTDLAESYYFVPDGWYHLVESYGLADYTTSSASTLRRTALRRDVAQRDGNYCVITRTPRNGHHATHIIPHSKGDEYIRFVISDRRSLYEDQQVYLRSDVNIDSPENGMFLTPDLHCQFGLGMSAFLKTPNFALDPADIPRVEPGEIPASRTTMQHIEPPGGRVPVPQLDVQPDWAIQGAPPSLLLDYMYGVAVIQRWATTDIQDVLKHRHETCFNFPLNTPSSPLEDEYDDSAQCRAVDTAFAFTMFFKGYPPGTTFDMICQK